MNKTQRVLEVFVKAVNKIEDYFEYRSESIEDRRIVKIILTDLHRDINKIDKGN